MKVYIVLSENQMEKPLVFNSEEEAYIEACKIADKAMIEYGQLEEGECMHDVFCNFRKLIAYRKYSEALAEYNDAMPERLEGTGFESEDMIFVSEAEYKGVNNENLRN